jgi:RHS repeat-associated protein
VTYSYDWNGNLTSTSDYRSYSYDDENQLTRAEQYQQWRTDFLYDGLGRLRVRAEYVWLGGGWYPNGETRYIYDGRLVIQERNSSNTPTVSYTRGIDLSGTLHVSGGIGGLLARSHGYSGGSWSTHNYYHADGGGNVTYIINASQAMVAIYKYDPYGKTLSSSGTLAGANVYRFSSKEIHLNSGLYYYGYRFYDPNLQRWLNQDPICEFGFRTRRLLRTYHGKPNKKNLYTFVANSPNSKWDYLGLCGKSCDAICADFNKSPYAFIMSPGTLVCGESGQKCACYVPGKAYPPKGECPELEKNIIDHEKRHFSDISCDGKSAGMLGIWVNDVSYDLVECSERARSLIQLGQLVAHAPGKCKKAMQDLYDAQWTWVMSNCD